MTFKVIFLTAGSTWTVPDDWNSAANTIECIGAGGGGYRDGSASCGGGGGAYSRISNLKLTPGDVIQYRVGPGGVADSISGGGHTWFNGTGLSSASVSAEGGSSGYYGDGGWFSYSIGEFGYDGGATIAFLANTGGAGAGGKFGAGSPGTTTPGAANGSRTPAGTAGVEYTATNTWNGTAYTNTTPTGGAGGGGNSTNPGANYGGGGGSTLATAQAGAPGLIIVSYDATQALAPPPDQTSELFFSETVQEMLEGRNVFTAMGVWFDFTSGEDRIWLGRGTFTARDGTVWSGLGELASIDGIQSSAGLSTEPITMTLSGVDTEILDLTRAQASEIRGRRCGVYILMFNETGQPIDEPYLIDLYLMDKASFTVSGETREMSITVTAEPLFSTKHVPKFSLMSDQDQQTRYPGDRIFERVALMAGRQTVVWSSDT